MKYQGKEDNFQITCMSYLARFFPELEAIHVPNEGIKVEGNKAIIYGAKRKAKGVKKGVPDILIFDTAGLFKGLAVELKVDGGKVSKEQNEFMERMKKRGWATEICWSVDEFVNVIDKYYKKY